MPYNMPWLTPQFTQKNLAIFFGAQSLHKYAQHQKIAPPEKICISLFGTDIYIL